MTDNTLNATILIVDDESELRDLLQKRFESRGATVLTAEGARIAKLLCHANPIDIIVTDIRMPDGDGSELMEFVKKMMPEPQPTVLCISGYADLTIAEVFQRGGSALFGKPVQFETLMAAVGHFAGRRKRLLTALNDQEA